LDPFSVRRVAISPEKTTEIKSDLFELSRTYPGECRHREQQIFGNCFESTETKFDTAEVGVASQVNGGLF
jgi:hypothetical protein